VKKKTVKRIVALVSTAALSAAALVMFAGCTTRHPQVTITYTFNGEDYEVDYTLLEEVKPQDLTKFGLIPEFVGRVPIVVGLHPLDEDALIKILTEPKNALVKQYKKQFSFDGVNLEFEPDALRAVAAKAIELKTGARGLRAIMEDALLDLMYDIPSDKSIDSVTITRDVIEKKAAAIIRRTEETAGEDEILRAFETDKTGESC